MKYIINTDGGARGNPGPAAAAFIIVSGDGKEIYQKGIYMGIATNNEAEYFAVEKAIETLIIFAGNTLEIEVELRADSELVVKQLSNLWKLKNERLKVFYRNIKQLEDRIENITYIYIPRAQNHKADLIVNTTLDNQT